MTRERIFNGSFMSEGLLVFVQNWGMMNTPVVMGPTKWRGALPFTQFMALDEQNRQRLGPVLLRRISRRWKQPVQEDEAHVLGPVTLIAVAGW